MHHLFTPFKQWIPSYSWRGKWNFSWAWSQVSCHSVSLRDLLKSPTCTAESLAYARTPPSTERSLSLTGTHFGQCLLDPSTYIKMIFASLKFFSPLIHQQNNTSGRIFEHLPHLRPCQSLGIKRWRNYIFSVDLVEFIVQFEKSLNFFPHSNDSPKIGPTPFGSSGALLQAH